MASSTSTKQRVFIWVMAAVMTIGTIGSFFVMILANNNAASDQQKSQAEQAKMMEDYQKQYEEMQKKQDEEAKKLSKQYYPVFSKYESLPEPFDGSKVKKLETEDLKKGDGAELKDGTDYLAYYIGWNTEGKVFDGSIDGASLKYPIAGTGLIEGWTEGVKGMKIGGVRMLTIPGDLAKGLTPSADIKEGAPLRFVVMAIPPADDEDKE